MEYTQKHWKPEERIEVAEDLPLTDCYVAPVLLPALSSKIFRNTSVCLANTAMPTRWNSSTNATLCPPLPVIFAITSANTTVPARITTVLNIRELKKSRWKKVGMNISNAGTNQPVLVHAIRLP